jgi:hypothetical protein
MVNVVMYDILWTMSRRLCGVYTVFFLHSGPLGPLSTVSSVNIYKNTKMKNIVHNEHYIFFLRETES